MATIKRFFTNPAEFKKGYVALVTFLGEALTAGVLHGTAQHEVQVILPLLTFISVVVLKNKQPSSTDALGTASTHL